MFAAAAAAAAAAATTTDPIRRSSAEQIDQLKSLNTGYMFREVCLRSINLVSGR